MPLHDSLGSQDAVKLPKMNSMPTTEDLKFALMQVTKKGGAKVCELPFEHPTNHQTFIVQVKCRPGTKDPNWTLIRGEGAGSKALWSRSADVMIIQNKIKIDSQYQDQTNQSAASAVDMPSHEWDGNPRKRGAIAMGSSSSFSKNGDSQPIALGGPTSENALSDAVAQGSPAPPTLDAFFGRDYPPQLNAFIAQPPETRTLAEQPQTFVPNAKPLPELKPLDRPARDKTVERAPVEPSPPPPPPPPPAPPPAPTRESVIEVALDPPKPKPPSVPLPPPIKFDKKILNDIHKKLANEETGMMSYAAWVFFLFRDFVRYQKAKTPFSVVIFEVAIRGGSGVLPLPPSAVTNIADRVRKVCGPLDILTHLNAGEFGAMVACVNGDAAIDFASALSDALTEEPVSLGGQDFALIVAAGAASIPETCSHPEVLVAAARQAKEMAKMANTAYMLFPA